MRCFAGTAILLLGGLLAQAADKSQPKSNTLSPQEIAKGWILLFDGETNFGWKIDGETRVADGVWTLGGTKATKADLTSEFGNWELSLEYTGSGQMVLDNGQGINVSAGLGDVAQWTRLAMEVRFEPKVQLSIIGRDLIGVATAFAKGKAIFDATAAYNSEHLILRFDVAAGDKLALRNIKLKPVGLKSIFNGKDLSGWKVIPGHKSKFSVNEKGELTIKDGNGDIQTEGQWDDFVLQLEVLSHGKHLNSGVFFRCLPGQFWSGYEAQIRNQWQGDDRTKAVDYGTGGIYNRQPARKVVSNDHEWFTMTVVAQGKHIATWVNGYQVTDFTDQRPLSTNARKGCKLDKGPISLQGHDPTTSLSFRNIRIAELPKAGK
jgi:hypothetical protein